MENWLLYIIICTVGYLCGNFNSAHLFSRINKKDISKMGSGNPGTMNMVRNLGAKWGALTFICDAAKGVAASVTGFFVLGGTGLYAAGIAAVIGHCYPIFFLFKGGKGVACGIGVFLVASPLISLIVLACGAVFLLIVQYASLTSLGVITAMTIIEGSATEELIIKIMIFAIWAFIWFGHRTNIIRAITGTERKTNLIKSFRKIDPEKTEKKLSKNS